MKLKNTAGGRGGPNLWAIDSLKDTRSLQDLITSGGGRGQGLARIQEAKRLNLMEELKPQNGTI